MICIVADGLFPRSGYPKHLLSAADRIICCDGALSSLEKRGIVPDVVIGDLDSVCSRALKRFKGTVVKDSDQETNDLSKAFVYLLKNYPTETEIHILGATGQSEAHTIGNISLLMDYQKMMPHASIDMVSDYCTAIAVYDSCSLFVGEGRRISIFSPDNSLKIKSTGLRWKTDDVVFDNWWKAALNIASDDFISLKFNHPSKAVIIMD